MPEINPLTKDQLFEKKIAENTGSNYNVGDISDVVPVTKDQSLLKEIALNSAGQSEDITELEGKVTANAEAIGSLPNLNTEAKSNLVAAINEITKTTAVTTGDINEILTEHNPYRVSFITVLAQAGGFTMTNWIGNVDGYIVKLGGIAIAFSGWDLSIRPYYKLNGGGSAANWSQWYQF